MTFIASSSIMLPQNLDPTAIYTMSGLTATIAAIASLSATNLTALTIAVNSLTANSLTAGTAKAGSLTADSFSAIAAAITSLTANSLTALTTAIAGLSATNAYFTGTYTNPVIIADKRLWYDSVNDVLRVKNSAPSSAIDGYILNEGEL